MRTVLRLSALALLSCAVSSTADRGIVPISVCDLIRDLPSHDGQTVAIVGRYSYRSTGQWVTQLSCPAPPAEAPSTLLLVEDSKEAPKSPDVFEFDAAVLDKKLAEVQAHTPLSKIRFGATDFDRWAVIWGKIEVRKGDDAKQYAANLIVRSSSVIIWLPRP